MWGGRAARRRSGSCGGDGEETEDPAVADGGTEGAGATQEELARVGSLIFPAGSVGSAVILYADAAQGNTF